MWVASRHATTMSRDIMSEQQINIQFVKEVQKHPTLYNFQLPTYSRKDISDKAWEEVGKATNMTPSACRERWRNLRAVFMRNMKAPPKCTGKKKPYYLADAMKFVKPFMRPIAIAEANKERQKQQEQTAAEALQSKETEKDILFQVEQIKVEQVDEVDSDDWCLQNTEEAKHSRKRSIQEPEDHIPNKKIIHVPIVPPAPPMMINENDHVKSFLNSLVPELNEMNSAQFKNFKRRVLLLIDDIMTEIPSSTRQSDDSEYIM